MFIPFYEEIHNSVFRTEKLFNNYWIFFFTFLESRLAPTITGITSTTSSFSVFWNPPNIDSELVTEYEVQWKVTGLGQSSGRLNNSVNSLNVSSGLMSGKLYTVNVISHGNLTNPAKPFVVTSDDFQVRLGKIYDTITITRILLYLWIITNSFDIICLLRFIWFNYMYSWVKIKKTQQFLDNVHKIMIFKLLIW